MADNQDSVEPTQSLPLCILFTGISGLLRVVATMVLAYPDFLQKKQGTATSATGKTIYISAHLFILAIAAVLSIIGTIFGPVALAVPVQTGSSLLFNVVAMGIVLKMRAFNKAQRTGTYVLFFSILSLVDVGPGVQDNQDALQLLSTPIAIGWCVFIASLMLLASFGTVELLRGGQSTPSFIKNNSTLILVIGTCMSNVSMATSSKTFGSLRGGAFAGAMVFYLVATLVGVLFSVVSSTACDQGIFTSLASVALIVTNMITGMIVWEDWKVMDTWIAYICAVFLMSCGVYLLAEVDILDKFYRKAMADVVLGPQPAEPTDSGDGGDYGSFQEQEQEEMAELEGVVHPDSDTDAWEATFSANNKE